MRFELAVATFLMAIEAEATSYQKTNTNAYLAKSRHDKMDIMWDNIMADTTGAGWYPAYKLPGLLTESEKPVFDTVGDELPNTLVGLRDKLIHSYGTVGKASFVSNGNHPYTGVFKGSDSMLIRLSLALEPDSSVDNIAPGVGVKFLRDGIDSGNMVVMYGVDGQDGWNFFENDFSNHISNATTAGPSALAKKFSGETKWITQVGLSDMATYGQDGKKESNPVFPFKVVWKPTGEVSFPQSYQGDTIKQLATIPTGKRLYEMWAQDKPDQLGGSLKKIGDIITTSQQTSSFWGDRHFYIRHQKYSEDLALASSWEKYSNFYNGPEVEEGLFGCPFKYFLQ